MADLTIRGARRAQTSIAPDALGELRATLRGEIVTPDSPAYDATRSIWNAMIDRRPGLIVRCGGSDDVVAAVRFARTHDLLVSVRGAGHNIAGHAVSDGGVMIDLSPMRSVTVDPTARTAIVAPGATLGDVDAATAPHGLALPMGINSTTGIAGLTLGGGFGWLTRKHGLTVDNLLSAEVVTADGDRLTASASRNADLFWGIRGGGGNFGVVTSFTFRLHRVGPDLLCGLIVHPFAQAPALLGEYRRLAAAAPDELTAWVVLRKAPPLPFLPPEVHGKEVMVIAAVYAGDVWEGEKALQPLRALGSPIADVIAPQPFAAFQQAFDPLLGAGARNYWKSHDYTALSDGVLDVTLEYAARLPNEQCEIFIAHLGGAAGRVPADATAYAHRDAEFVMNVHTRWTDPAEDRKCVGWAREFFDRAAPFATGGVYVNFMPDDEADRVPSAYGGNYQRLVQLKAKYDPENFFRQNQNIRPAGR